MTALLMLGLVVGSCDSGRKPPENPETMDELVVNRNFDWKTTANYELTITGKSSRVVSVTSAEGKVFKKAMVTPAEPLKVLLTLPTAVKSVFIKYAGQEKELALSGPVLTYNFE